MRNRRKRPVHLLNICANANPKLRIEFTGRTPCFCKVKVVENLVWFRQQNWPGIEIEPGNLLTDYEAEVIAYAINEGMELQGTLSSEDDPGMSSSDPLYLRPLRWKLQNYRFPYLYK